MAIYSLGLAQGNINAGHSAWELASGAALGFRLMETGVSVSTTAGTQSAQVVRVAAATSPTTSTHLVAEDPGNAVASNAVLNTAWAAQPTITSNTQMRYANGGGLIWYFPRGIICEAGGSGPTSSLVLYTPTSLTLPCSYVVVDE